METQVLPGWAGYVVHAGAIPLTEVHGRWVQPRVVCNRPGSSAAFWVGLGGASRASRALEQIGTSADCSGAAVPSHSAWYQLWPARAVELPLAVRPGDTIDASVGVAGGIVTVALRNESSGAAFSKQLWMWEPETDSAEWIVEAPAVCFTTCTQLPLVTFGRITFTQTSATVGGHTGTISDPSWTPYRLKMGIRNGRTFATPSSLFENGWSFAVLRSPV